MLFIFLVFFGSIFSISASSWFIVWVGLEINTLAIITLMASSSCSRSKEASIKYFLIQALAASSLLGSALIASMVTQSFSNINLISLLIFFSLLTKMGAAPFHLWLPQIIDGLSWPNLSLILTWQKAAPFILLLNCIETAPGPSPFLLSAAMLSATVGGASGLSQHSTRKILAFSSINHLGWAMGGLAISLTLWSIYFLIYSSLLFSVVLLTSMLNISSVNHSNLFSPPTKISFFSSLFSFGGLPPFLGFLPKWMIITQLKVISLSLTLILVLSSLLPLIFYMILAFKSFFNKSTSPSLLKEKSSSMLPLSFNFFGSFMFIMMLLW